ncbi:MAG TPA: A24 family peptidase [Steroidobacteraceae bacterium]|jgi:prepilin peptidase CpaA
MASLASVLLAGILSVAVYSDMQWHRIPNWLSLTALIAGLGLQTLVGATHGLIAGLLGTLVGLACFAPFFLLRGMGAGDVKLLAAVGSFMGPQGAFYAALASLLAGGAGALAYVAWRVGRAATSTLIRDGLAAVSASAFIAAKSAQRDRLPFALPIAIGSIAAWCYGVQSSGSAGWLTAGHA